MLLVGQGHAPARSLFDLTRDPSHRTHLGRLFERIDKQGSSGFTTVVSRKLHANFATLFHSVWRLVIMPIVIIVVIAALVALILFDRKLGVVYLDSTVTRDHFNREHLQLVTAIAGIAAVLGLIVWALSS